MFYKRADVLDLLAANNLKLVTNEQGKPLLNLSGKAGLISVEPVEADKYTPQALYNALAGAERAEKEFMKTGKRVLETDNKSKDSDYDLARLIATHLTNDSLKMLASRGLHGRYAGDRVKMEDAVQDLLYKGSFNRDLYTNTYIGNMPRQMGHTTANSLGGVELRPELAAINTSLKNTEGEERLEAIRRKRVQLNAMKAIEENPEIVKDPDVARLIMGDTAFVKDLLAKAANYGFNIDEKVTGASTRVDSPGTNRERALIINSEGGDVNIGHDVLRSNGNGNHKNN